MSGIEDELEKVKYVVLFAFSKEGMNDGVEPTQIIDNVIPLILSNIEEDGVRAVFDSNMYRVDETERVIGVFFPILSDSRYRLDHWRRELNTWCRKHMIPVQFEVFAWKTHSYLFS